MKLGQENDWIFSDVDLNLCVQMLGQQENCDFLIAESSKPLEERMLESFLSLTELGLICPQGEGYVCSESMRKRFLPLAYPDRTVIFSIPSQQASCAVYWKGQQCIVVEKQGPDSFGYRVGMRQPGEAEKLLRDFSACIPENHGEVPDLPVPERFDRMTPEELLCTTRLFCSARDGNSGAEQICWVVEAEEASWLLTPKTGEMAAYTWKNLFTKLLGKA